MDARRRDCQIIIVSNKQQRDGVYFPRITVDQLLFLLKRLRYPQERVSFFEQNRARLDHMLYDVGFDYRVEDGVLKIVKSAYREKYGDHAEALVPFPRA